MFKQLLKATLAGLAGVGCLCLSAEEKTMEADWCSIRYPDKVEPGKSFTVTVTPKEAPEGMKVGGDLHHATAGSYIGFAAWGGTPKKAVAGQPLTFTYKMPKFVDAEQGAQPIFFLTTKGWDEAVKKAPGPIILPLVDQAVAQAAAEQKKAAESAPPPPLKAGEQKAEFDWCTIQYPEKVAPGEKFNVVVVLKTIPENMKVGGDLHNATKDSYLGFAAWGGTPKNAKSGQALTFSYKMPKFVDAEQGAHPIFFLTPKGWDEATQKAPCPVILPLVK